KCCGAPNMLGHDREGLVQAASYNTELFEAHSFDFVVTDCGGCGAELKKYGHHLQGREDATAFSAKVRDISEVLAGEAEQLMPLLKPLPVKVTYHDPCHISHCQGIRNQPRALIKMIPGIDFRELPEADSCCGSAGTYNLEKPEMSDRVLNRKVANVQKTGAEYLVTGNPGCLLQLKKALAEAAPQVKVIHLTELLQMSIDA
ncbi:(Fe-S)-binding protein, partial [Geomonas sp.]|uniref:(Fe-S)-binding protein n=1 Tax=Geomonas sp. TaxID=2651584 RepID=UPI002B49C399